tara:strand:- start:112 stop:417 length:306 start_codon:yes stop_codon:yes gene_type:complete
MTDEAPKKRRGRPSKKKVDQELAPAFLQEEKKQTREIRASVEELKTPCVHCGKTNLLVVKTDAPVQVCHRSQGKTFNALIRRLLKCKDCNRHNSINSFEIR